MENAQNTREFKCKHLKHSIPDIKELAVEEVKIANHDTIVELTFSIHRLITEQMNQDKNAQQIKTYVESLDAYKSLFYLDESLATEVLSSIDCVLLTSQNTKDQKTAALQSQKQLANISSFPSTAAAGGSRRKH